MSWLPEQGLFMPPFSPKHVQLAELPAAGKAVQTGLAVPTEQYGPIQVIAELGWATAAPPQTPSAVRFAKQEVVVPLVHCQYQGPEPVIVEAVPMAQRVPAAGASLRFFPLLDPQSGEVHEALIHFEPSKNLSIFWLEL
jgi:hypothetical protein